MHLPALIVDLVVILIAAGLTTLLFKWLKQPLVLGYLLAGVLAGPAVKVLPTVREVSSIDTWGEIGVIFLLFNLGLDFSVKKLMKVGGTATVGAAGARSGNARRARVRTRRSSGRIRGDGAHQGRCASNRRREGSRPA